MIVRNENFISQESTSCRAENASGSEAGRSRATTRQWVRSSLAKTGVSDNVDPCQTLFERTAPCTPKSAPFRSSVGRVLPAENAGQVADEDHGTWYRELFAPSVAVGLLERADLAGYRNGQVHIRKSMHVPPNHEAVRDASRRSSICCAKRPTQQCALCSSISCSSTSILIWTATVGSGVS